MKYIPMQTGMWAVFAASFRKNLTAIFGLDGKTARTVTANAKQTYAQILKELPDFEKGDRFLMNIVSCAMLAAFVLSMPERPDVTRLTSYYEQSMMTPAMRFYCRKSGSRRFSPESLSAMEKLRSFAPRTGTRIPGTWTISPMPTAPALKRASRPAASVS